MSRKTPKCREPICIIGPSIAYIPLTRGFHALVDSDDAEELGKYSWCVCPNKTTVYASRSYRIPGEKRRTNSITMHAHLLGRVEGKSVDHIKPRNGLDNRRCNLRHANQAQQTANRVFGPNSTGFTGVYKRKNRPTAFVATFRGKFVGCAKSPEAAYAIYAAARDEFNAKLWEAQ